MNHADRDRDLSRPRDRHSRLCGSENGCKRIRGELEAAPPSTEVIALHPAVLAHYEEQLTSLQGALRRGARSGDSECAEAIRDLVDTVTVFRDTSKPGGVEVEIVGRLTALLGEQAYPSGVRGVWGKMVAEERYRLSPQLLHLTYRLRSSA